MEGTLNSSGFPASGLSRCLPRCVLRSGGFVALTLVYEDLAKLAALIWQWQMNYEKSAKDMKFSYTGSTLKSQMWIYQSGGSCCCISQQPQSFVVVNVLLVSKSKTTGGRKGDLVGSEGGLKSLQTTTALPSKCQRVHSAACSFRVKLAMGSYMLKFVMYVAPTESAFFCRCDKKGRMRNRQLVLTNGKKAFVPVYVGMCFQAISLKTVFPLSELFQEVKKCTCTHKHTSRKHTTGKANTDMTI